MDAFLREMEGRRHGRVCPCCSATRTKRGDTRRTRARFKADTRREVNASVKFDHPTTTGLRVSMLSPLLLAKHGGWL